MENYDVVFIGAGPGGYVGAIRAAQRGAKVAVVEQGDLGGVCLNRGCIPTKALLASVEALEKAKHLHDFGITLNGGVAPDFGAMNERRRGIVKTLVGGIAGLLKANHITVVHGAAKIESPNTIAVTSDGATKLGAKKIVIATGARPAALPHIRSDHSNILTSDDILESSIIHESIVIVGGGAIGCEWATIFSALGTKVTIVEALPRLLPLEDEDVSAIIEREFKKRKVALKTGAKITGIEIKNGGAEVSLDNGAKIEASCVLIAVGRAPNTQDIGLESVGVKTVKSGRIEVNDRMETSLPGVYAIGDAAGTYPMLAHVASAQGIVAAENATGGDSRFEGSAIPSCVYTTPEAASVGLRELEAEEKGIGHKVGRFEIRTLGRAQARGEIAGMVKIVADLSGKIIGVHIVAHGASDLIHEGVLAVKNGLTVERLAETIHGHPTFAEGLMEAAEDVMGKAIHIAPKKRDGK